jgi:hypothetical protein
MSDRHVVDRRLDAPADAVLAAILEAAAATRFTDMPKPVRGDARGLKGKVRGTRFTVRLDTISDRFNIDVAGAVLSQADGATRVHATAEEDRNAGAGAVAMAVLGLVLWVLRVEDVGWTLMGLAALVGLGRLVFHGADGRGDVRAAYLAEWLNGVLDRFPAAPPASPPPSDLPERDPVPSPAAPRS